MPPSFLKIGSLDRDRVPKSSPRNHPSSPQPSPAFLTKRKSEADLRFRAGSIEEKSKASPFQAVRSLKTAAHDKITRAIAAPVSNVAQKATHSAVGRLVRILKKHMIDVRWQPRVFAALINDGLDFIEKEVVEASHDEVEEQLKETNAQREMKKHVLSVRVVGAIDWRRHPYRAFRASMLYRLYPADETWWYRMQDPLNLVLALLWALPGRFNGGFNDW
jgi:hypothetical protein